MAAKTRKPPLRGRPWPRGTSGNPAGRPQGSRNKATLAAQQLLDGEAELLTRKAIDLALAGDTTAMRLCLERLIAPRKERPIELKLPSLDTAQQIAAALTLAVKAVGEGRITPTEAQILVGLMDARRKAIETAELERRVNELEQAVKGQEREGK